MHKTWNIKNSHARELVELGDEARFVVICLEHVIDRQLCNDFDNTVVVLEFLIY
jgi:hypothetical protein